MTKHGLTAPLALRCIHALLALPAPAGTFDTNIDRPLKFWQSARWDGQSGSGAYVKEHGGGDLHIALSWLTTLPPVTQQVRKL